MKVSDMGDISVIIPTYKRPSELQNCLDRLAPDTQTTPFSNYEVIVADDEGTGSVSHRLIKEKYPWVQWVAGPGLGAAANRNCGAKEAKFEWLVFTDDDCLPDQNWLAAYQRAIHEAESRVLEGKTVEMKERPGPGWTAPINYEGGKLYSCNFAIHQSLFHQLGGFDEGYPNEGGEDVDFRVRVECEVISIPFVPEAKLAHPWRRLKPISYQVQRYKSYDRFFNKFPSEANRYNANYHLVVLVNLILHLFFCARGKEWRREFGRKLRSAIKSIIIIKYRILGMRQ